METTLLISYNDILHYTTVSGDINASKLNPHINNAQILYIEPILGSDLFNKIVTLISDNSITATTYADYNTLLSTYITPSLVFHTLELFIPLNSFQLADGGTFQYTPTNAQYSPLDEIDKITNKYRIIGSKYDKKLYDYLCENSSLFTEYTSNTGLVNASENTIRAGGFYLGTSSQTNKIRT
jgi:hypothetical protein